MRARSGGRPCAAPTTTQATASGLRAIQATSAAGKAASAAGWARTEGTNSVDAHVKAAAPPGTIPWRVHGWPGSPASRSRSDGSPRRRPNRPPRKSPTGRAGPCACRRGRAHARPTPPGGAASTPEAPKRPIAPDMTTIASDVVRAVAGAAHCHPIVSCDHMAPPNREDGERGRPAGRGWRRPARRPRAGPLSPAAARRATSRRGSRRRCATATVGAHRGPRSAIR